MTINARFWFNCPKYGRQMKYNVLRRKEDAILQKRISAFLCKYENGIIKRWAISLTLDMKPSLQIRDGTVSLLFISKWLNRLRIAWHRSCTSSHWFPTSTRTSLLLHHSSDLPLVQCEVLRGRTRPWTTQRRHYPSASRGSFWSPTIWEQPQLLPDQETLNR